MASSSTLHPEGWISVNVDLTFEEQAKQMRAERDKRYGNIYPEADDDERWVGDLGEITFKSWLRHEGITNFKWVTADVTGQPDFVVSLIRIDVKSVKRQGPPKKSYTAQITAQHANEPVDYFFFMSYEIGKRQMWLLGGIERDRFLSEATYYKDGEWVHKYYQVRGHDIYNIELTKLIQPMNWIEQIKSQTTSE